MATTYYKRFRMEIDLQGSLPPAALPDGFVWVPWNEALLDMFRNVQHVYKWGIHDRDPIPQWTKGRVTLLGDACHAMLPYLGQGANSAMEDGFVLARCIAAWPGDP